MNEKIKKTKEKKITVGIFVDFMGCGDQDPEDERKEIKRLFKEYIPEKKFIFRDLEHLNLKNENFDILVVDYGGILPGAGGLLGSFGHQIEEFLEDHPRSILIIWTSMTWNEFEDVVKEDKLLKFDIMQYEIYTTKMELFWEGLRKKLLLREDAEQK